MLSALATPVVAVAWVGVVALLAVLPLSLAGPASGTTNHLNALD